MAPDDVTPQEDRPRTDAGQIDGQRTDPASSEGSVIHLPSLISDEFGVAQQQAFVEIIMGRVEVDGEALPPGTTEVDRDAIMGKTIVVTGQTRSFRVVYNGGTNDRPMREDRRGS